MPRTTLRRTTAILACTLALALASPSLEAAPAARRPARGEQAPAAERFQPWNLSRILWTLVSNVWAKTGPRIDGNG